MKAVAGYLPVDLEPHARAAVAGPLDAQRHTQATAPRPQPYLRPSTVNVADTSVSMGGGQALRGRHAECAAMLRNVTWHPRDYRACPLLQQ